MILTNDNYFSEEANKKFMSVSQYKNWVGTLKEVGCEARTMAELDGKWVREKTDALMMGSYLDAYFEGSLEQFKQDNPSIFNSKIKGEPVLKKAYENINEVIKRIERDKYFMGTM